MELRGCARAAVKAGNQDDLRTGLGNARGNRADTGLADELDIDGCLAVGALQIVDQLRQVLDRVNIVVGRGEIRPTPVVELRVLATHG